MTTVDERAARAQFCALVAAEWAAASGEQPNVKEANRQVASVNELVGSWAEHGDAVVQAVLVPLLDDEAAQIRYSAAAHLLRHGASEQARVVLEELADNEDAGSVGTLADAALLGWEREQTSTN